MRKRSDVRVCGNTARRDATDVPRKRKDEEERRGCLSGRQTPKTTTEHEERGRCGSNRKDSDEERRRGREAAGTKGSRGREEKTRGGMEECVLHRVPNVGSVRASRKSTACPVPHPLPSNYVISLGPFFAYLAARRSSWRNTRPRLRTPTPLRVPHPTPTLLTPPQLCKRSATRGGDLKSEVRDGEGDEGGVMSGDGKTCVRRTRTKKTMECGQAHSLSHTFSRFCSQWTSADTLNKKSSRTYTRHLCKPRRHAHVDYIFVLARHLLFFLFFSVLLFSPFPSPTPTASTVAREGWEEESHPPHPTPSRPPHASRCSDGNGGGRGEGGGRAGGKTE